MRETKAEILALFRHRAFLFRAIMNLNAAFDTAIRFYECMVFAIYVSFANFNEL